MDFKSISGGKMVTDFDDSSVPKNYYPDGAINLRNGKYIGSVGTAGGNTVSSGFSPSGTNDTICSVADLEDKLVYSLVRNSAGNHAIVELNDITNTSSVIFQNLIDSEIDVLNWDANTDISSLKFIDGGDLDEYGNKIANVLLWTDASTEIRYFNIGKSRKYTFPGSTTVVNIGGVCTVSNSAIIPCGTLRYVCVDGINWLRVTSIATGSLVVSGTVANGTYSNTRWAYRDFIQYHETVLIKAPPLLPVKAEYDSDSTITYNNLHGDLYQFIQQNVYDDNQLSAWSLTSAIPIPSSDFSTSDSGSLVDNKINLTINTGERSVIGVNIGYKAVYNSPNNYYLIKYIDKKKLGLGDNASYDLAFTNDQSYIPIAVSEVTNLDYDHVPIKAGALDLLNNGSLVFGDVSDGYDNPDVVMSASIQTNTGPSNTSTLEVIYNPGPPHMPGGSVVVTVKGTINQGDSVYFESSTYQHNPSTGNWDHAGLQFETVTATSTDTLMTFADKLFNRLFLHSATPFSYIVDTSVQAVAQATNVLYSTGSSNPFYLSLDTFVVTRATVLSGISAALSLKTGSAYKVGVRYGDEFGRKSPVYYSDNCYLKTLDYYNLADNFQFIEWEIDSQPPLWASWYSIVVSKNLTHLNTYYGIAKGMSYDSSKPDVMTVNIANLQSQVAANGLNYVNYNYAKGDRFRFLKNETTNTKFTTYFDTEVLSDDLVTSGSTVTRTLTIRVPTSFDMSLFGTPTGTVATTTNKILFEVYSPKKSNDVDNVFYSIGSDFLIQNPGTVNRYHYADEQNQTSSQPAKGVILGIDCFVKNRSIAQVENDTAPVLTLVEDFNLSDYFKCSIIQIGTPSVEDSTYRRVRRKVTLIHTDPLIPETNINGLNRVYPGYFKDYDITMGAFRRLISKGTYLQAIHENDSQRIPISASIIMSADGATQLGLSTDLLNNGIPYKGGFGIGNNGSALVDTGFFTYIIDGNKGVFARLGLDGWDDIGIECGFSNGIHALCLPYRSLQNKIKLGYDPLHKDVIIAYKTAGSLTGRTLAYSEKLDGFTTYFSYQPEALQHIGSNFYTFSGGKSWLHNESLINNWYGVSYYTTFDLLFNDEYQFAKICRFIKIFSNVLVSPMSLTTDTGGSTSMVDSMFDIEVSTDYAKSLVKTSIDGAFVAAVPMDQNSDGGIYDGLPLRGKVIRVSLKANQNTVENRLQGMFLGYVKL